MTRFEAKLFVVEGAGIVAVATGVVIMFLSDFYGSQAAWGLLLTGTGVVGFSVTHWLRRQCNIRFRRRFWQ